MSTAPNVDALERGLEVLTFLNKHNYARVAEVARGVGLPRTTVFRLLETLCSKGYVLRSAGDRLYCVSSKVTSLALGYNSAARVAEVAQPYVRALKRELLWPIIVTAPAGDCMVWYGNTERESPLAIRRYKAGNRIGIGTSASGLLYLAFSQALFEDLREPLKAEIIAHYGSRALFDEAIRRALTDGYAMHLEQGWPEGLLAVPIAEQDRYYGNLGVRYTCRTVSNQQIVDRCLASLRRTAAEIAQCMGAQDYTENSPG